MKSFPIGYIFFGEQTIHINGSEQRSRYVSASCTCVVCLVSLSLGVTGDDLGDELPGCGVDVGQQGAVVGAAGEGISIDLDEAWCRGRSRGEVVVGGRGS